jgi:hypothetical protein
MNELVRLRKKVSIVFVTVPARFPRILVLVYSLEFATRLRNQIEDPIRVGGNAVWVVDTSHAPFPNWDAGTDRREDALHFLPAELDSERCQLVRHP